MNAPRNLTRNFANPRGIQPAPNPVPAGARPEIFLQDVSDVPEERWVQQAENVAFLPLTFGVTQGYYVNLLRVRKSGVLSCHRHFGAVHAHVMKGRWFYLEHDWVATEGSFVMETPGETHTLVVPDDVPEMITWFHVAAGYVYFENGRITAYEDVFTKLQRAREHYEEFRLPQAELDRLVR
jgi:2,4'-dihydroxyacetophenone dioxygenase